jgi:2-oxoglutarate ferredoxin oxidoreductase subunit beta
MMQRAGEHSGAAFLEVLQNCNIFNDGAWRDFTDKSVKEDRMLVLKHGEPMIFGAEKNEGIRLNGLQPEVVTIGENGVSVADLWVHDETDPDATRTQILSRMWWPDFPVPVGVFRRVPRPTHDQLLIEQIEGAKAARAAKGPVDLQKLLASGETWTVK